MAPAPTTSACSTGTARRTRSRRRCPPARRRASVGSPTPVPTPEPAPAPEQAAAPAAPPPDPADPEGFYYRSDHFSYAAKDIPIAFFFTGTHPDYHANSDSVEKIHFDKLTRIAQMIYQTGFNIANNPSAPAKDHLGPRAVTHPNP